MNIEPGVGRHQIGGWEFSPATGELRRRTDVRRLEPRAAKALQMLCDADGAVVSQEQLIAEVWGGRSLSDNSVAVVIGQLRKALDDDAREPKLIETIPKRGYRLRPGPPSGAPQASRRTVALIAGAVAVTALLGFGMKSLVAGPETVSVAVADVVNETGNPDHAPLARATSELIVTRLAERGFAVRRSGAADLSLEAKLVMWDGLPFLGLTATDRSGEVRWSKMARATPGAVPPAVDAGLDELAAQFPPKGGSERLAKAPSGR